MYCKICLYVSQKEITNRIRHYLNVFSNTEILHPDKKNSTNFLLETYRGVAGYWSENPFPCSILQTPKQYPIRRNMDPRFSLAWSQVSEGPVHCYFPMYWDPAHRIALSQS